MDETNSSNTKKRKCMFANVSEGNKRRRGLDSLNRCLINREEFKYMGTLSTIQIEGFRIDVGRAEILGRALETMTEIETAIFKNTHLEGEALTAVLDGLLCQTKLTRLDITGNKLTDSEAKRIWKFMSSCKTLQYLNLSNNVLEFNGAWVVDPLVSSSLLSLQLQKNRIGMKGEQYLFQAIGLNNTLKRIYLKGNKISGISIGEALMTNRSLQFVDLEATKLTEEGVLWISTALKTNKSLLILNMNRMNLSNTALLALLEALQSNVHIAYASINGTNVRSMLIREFHECFTEQSYFKQYKNEISDSERQLILSCNQVEEVSDDESDSDNEFISPSDTVPVPYKEFCLPTWNSDRPNAITLIKECPELVNEVTFGEDLDASHFAAQQKFHSSVEESFDNLAKKHNEANARVNNLKKSLMESQQEEKKLQDQLKEIKKRLENVSETVEKKEEAIIYHTIKAIRMNNKFNEAVANIETFRAAMRATEQQIEKVVPEAVQLIDGVLHVDYESLIPYLSEAIKQNYHDMNNMETKVDKIQLAIDALYKSFINKHQSEDTREKTNTRKNSPKSKWWISALLVTAIFAGVIFAFFYVKLENNSTPQQSPTPSPLQQSPSPSVISPSINSPNSPIVTSPSPTNPLPPVPPDYSSFNSSLDYPALADLFFATNGLNWTLYDNKFGSVLWFTSNSTICSWKGILCDNNQRVYQLHLGGFNLRGTIPDSIGTLEYLQLLSLDGNLISGTIPSSIGKLKNLAELSLTGNLLHGTIPEIVAQLHLEVLNLNNNQLEGTIPFILGYRTELRSLDLSNNNLNGTIPSPIFHLPQLERLRVSNNPFMASAIDPEMFKNALNTIHLSNCNLVGTIPNDLTNTHSLRMLILSNNHLIGTLPRLPKNIDKLDISNNQLSGKLNSISQSKIMILNLSYNNFTGGIDEVNNFLSISELNLQNNSFNGEFWLSNRLIGSITKLNLANNNFQHYGQNFTKPTYMQWCNMSNNEWVCPLPSWAISLCGATCT